MKVEVGIPYKKWNITGGDWNPGWGCSSEIYIHISQTTYLAGYTVLNLLID